MRYTLLIILAFILMSCDVATEYVDEEIMSRPAKVQISNSDLNKNIGDTVTLNGMYFDTLGILDSIALITWNPINPEQSSLVSDNQIIFNQSGLAQIEGSYNGVSDTISFTISDANNPFKLEISEISMEESMLKTSDSLLLTYEITKNSSPFEDFEIEDISWTSTDSNVISIENGLITAKSTGSAQIYFEYESAFSNSIEVKVTPEAIMGEFEKRPNSGYSLSGSASIIPNADGYELSFGSDFSSSNGPALVVYLSESEQVTGSSILLGNLISTKGEQTYNIPSNIDIEKYDWVIVHCDPFNVTFGYANMK